jgi:hypothetical protein
MESESLATGGYLNSGPARLARLIEKAWQEAIDWQSSPLCWHGFAWSGQHSSIVAETSEGIPADALCSVDVTNATAGPETGSSATDRATTIAIIVRIKRIKMPSRTHVYSAAIMASSSYHLSICMIKIFEQPTGRID